MPRSNLDVGGRLRVAADVEPDGPRVVTLDQVRDAQDPAESVTFEHNPYDCFQLAWIDATMNVVFGIASSFVDVGLTIIQKVIVAAIAWLTWRHIFRRIVQTKVRRGECIQVRRRSVFNLIDAPAAVSRRTALALGGSALFVDIVLTLAGLGINGESRDTWPERNVVRLGLGDGEDMGSKFDRVAYFSCIRRDEDWISFGTSYLDEEGKYFCGSDLKEAGLIEDEEEVFRRHSRNYESFVKDVNGKNVMLYEGKELGEVEMFPHCDDERCILAASTGKGEVNVAYCGMFPPTFDFDDSGLNLTCTHFITSEKADLGRLARHTLEYELREGYDLDLLAFGALCRQTKIVGPVRQGSRRITVINIWVFIVLAVSLAIGIIVLGAAIFLSMRRRFDNDTDLCDFNGLASAFADIVCPVGRSHSPGRHVWASLSRDVSGTPIVRYTPEKVDRDLADATLFRGDISGGAVHHKSHPNAHLDDFDESQPFY